MSATEELRRLLRERGVECYQLDFKCGHGVGWKDSNGYIVRAEQWCDALLVQAALTPEQAVDATVGRGTCELQKAPILCTIERYGVAERYGVTEWRKCSACGSKVLADPVRYCPSCGRKVVK